MPSSASPCVRVCRISEATGWCLGCGRAAEEIAHWLYLDAADRERVLSDLPHRMAYNAALVASAS